MYTVEMFLKLSGSTFFEGFNKKRKINFSLFFYKFGTIIFQCDENQSAMQDVVCYQRKIINSDDVIHLVSVHEKKTENGLKSVAEKLE